MEGMVGEGGKGRSGHREENTERDLEVQPGIKPRSSSQEKEKQQLFIFLLSLWIALLDYCALGFFPVILFFFSNIDTCREKTRPLRYQEYQVFDPKH